MLPCPQLSTAIIPFLWIGPTSVLSPGKIPWEPRLGGTDRDGKATGVSARLSDPHDLLNPSNPPRSTCPGGHMPAAGEGGHVAKMSGVAKRV